MKIRVTQPLSSPQTAVHPRKRQDWKRCLAIGLSILLPSPALAARVSDVTLHDPWAQARRFFDLTETYVAEQWLGCILMGVCCGLLGTFIVVRRMALVGDMLSHAVLPGLMIGYLATMEKNPVTLLIGALLAGLLASALTTTLRQTTKLRRDSVLGIVLGGFYAVGIVLFSMIQNLPHGDRSGLSDILMGSAASISRADLWLMGVVTLISLVAIGGLFKEFKTASFDPGFAQVLGVPERLLHYLLMVLLSLAVVISIQAVGVVLVSAMLIIPAATALFLGHRLIVVMIGSMTFGALSALGGAFFSFTGRSLPTGPMIILVAATFFAIAYLLSPQHGWIPRHWRRVQQAARIQRENTLKAIYHLLEANEFRSEVVPIHEVRLRRRRSETEILTEMQRLTRHGLATVEEDSIRLTHDGWERAREVVRNHRLWELYLTHSADIAADHVHDDAEKIEHILGEETVALLEERFGTEAIDPHGKEIPLGIFTEEAKS